MRPGIVTRIFELVEEGNRPDEEKERFRIRMKKLVEWLQQEHLIPSDAGLSIWVRAEDLRKIAPAIRKGAASISEQADFAEQRLGGIIGLAAAESLRKDAADMNSLAAFVANLTPPEEKEAVK